MLFNFDVGIAQKHGLNAAILYEYIWHSCETQFYKNDPQSLRDGRAWIYADVQLFHEALPYLTKEQIRYGLTTLQGVGLIEIEDFYTKNLDVKKWYTVVLDREASHD